MQSLLKYHHCIRTQNYLEVSQPSPYHLEVQQILVLSKSKLFLLHLKETSNQQFKWKETAVNMLFNSTSSHLIKVFGNEIIDTHKILYSFRSGLFIYIKRYQNQVEFIQTRKGYSKFTKTFDFQISDAEYVPSRNTVLLASLNIVYEYCLDDELVERITELKDDIFQITCPKDHNILICHGKDLITILNPESRLIISTIYSEEIGLSVPRYLNLGDISYICFALQKSSASRNDLSDNTKFLIYKIKQDSTVVPLCGMLSAEDNQGSHILSLQEVKQEFSQSLLLKILNITFEDSNNTVILKKEDSVNDFASRPKIPKTKELCVSHSSDDYILVTEGSLKSLVRVFTWKFAKNT